MIRDMTPADAESILDIYRQGLQTGEASFETTVPAWNEWTKKYHDCCRLVFASRDQVLGWAALAPVSPRHCYRGVAEVSIYIDTRHLGQGIGHQLMGALVEASETSAFWMLTSSIFPENLATRKLHFRHGFREVGIRQRIAQSRGRWRDTLLLERRSTHAGVE